MGDTIKIDPSLPHYEVRCFLATAEPGPEADRGFADLLRLPVGPAYSTDLNAVEAVLDDLGWWWHLSHIGASVIPNQPLKGAPVSNASMYDREGRPIEYHVSLGERPRAHSLMTAMVKAAFDLPAAYYVNASHVDEVLAKKPDSWGQMMRYYVAREENRQEQIRRWNDEQPATMSGDAPPTPRPPHTSDDGESRRHPGGR